MSVFFKKFPAIIIHGTLDYGVLNTAEYIQAVDDSV